MFVYSKITSNIRITTHLHFDSVDVKNNSADLILRVRLQQSLMIQRSRRKRTPPFQYTY